MAIRHTLWTNQEVDTLVAAYAEAHKQNRYGRFFTSKDWSHILYKVNQTLNTKEMKQIKNKIDTLIKTHKREQAKQNHCGMPSNWIYFRTMEEIQIIKEGNHHSYPTRGCDKNTSYDSNPCSKTNQDYSERNDEETLYIHECCDEQFSEFSYIYFCDPYSVLDFDERSDGQDEHEGLDTTVKELGEQLLRECETKSQPNLKVFELIKLKPDSDEFIEEVGRMFAEPTGDIATLHSFFPRVCL